jgi:AbrB family looped-hinge helix DNA binding protein
MVTTIPKSIRLLGRGQMTIPKEIREALQLEEDDQLSIFVVGRCMVLTPKKLQRAALAKAAEAELKAHGLSLDDVLQSLKEERKRYNKETYGI